jgi:hypothetical protein
MIVFRLPALLKIYINTVMVNTVLAHPPTNKSLTPSKFCSAIQEPPSLLTRKFPYFFPLCIEAPSNDAIFRRHRSIMRTINFTLFAVLSCIAMIGAIPIEDGALAGSIARRQDLPYVPLQQQLHGEKKK